MASRMSPEDMRRAQEQMAGMKGEDFAKVAAQAQTQMSAQQSYVLRVSNSSVYGTEVVQSVLAHASSEVCNS
jgi:hypothetical protein